MIRRIRRWFMKRRVRAVQDVTVRVIGHCQWCSDATMLYYIRWMYLCESCWIDEWTDSPPAGGAARREAGR